jgi:hypothetical protein
METVSLQYCNCACGFNRDGIGVGIASVSSDVPCPCVYGIYCTIYNRWVFQLTSAVVPASIPPAPAPKINCPLSAVATLCGS